MLVVWWWYQREFNGLWGKQLTIFFSSLRFNIIVVAVCLLTYTSLVMQIVKNKAMQSVNCWLDAASNWCVDYFAISVSIWRRETIAALLVKKIPRKRNRNKKNRKHWITWAKRIEWNWKCFHRYIASILVHKNTQILKHNILLFLSSIKTTKVAAQHSLRWISIWEDEQPFVASAFLFFIVCMSFK